MSGDIKIGKYVVARHENGDRMYGEVMYITGEGTVDVLRVGGFDFALLGGGWTFEFAERPAPPLKDGVYQKANSLRRRTDGHWFYSDFLKDVCQDDDLYRKDGWQYVGPEASR